MNKEVVEERPVRIRLSACNVREVAGVLRDVNITSLTYPLHWRVLCSSSLQPEHSLCLIRVELTVQLRL